MITETDLINGTLIAFIADDEDVKSTFIRNLTHDIILNFVPDECGGGIKGKIYDAARTLNDWPLTGLLTTERDELRRIVFETAFEKNFDKAFNERWDINISDGGFKTYALSELPEIFTTHVLNHDYEYLAYLGEDPVDVLSENGFDPSYWDEDEEEKDEAKSGDENPKTYHIKLHIAYHRDYTAEKLTKRIDGRLHYKWPELEGTCVAVRSNGKGHHYTAHINIIVNGQELKEVCERIFFRLGKDSGKPWKRCKVVSVERIKD